MGRVNTRSMTRKNGPRKAKKLANQIICVNGGVAKNGKYLKKANITTLPHQRKIIYPYQKQLAWDKCAKVSGLNPREYRMDNYMNVIKYSEYGNRRSGSGWEIDHIKPFSKGGTNDDSNLQALQWYENVLKGNQYPYKPLQLKHVSELVHGGPKRGTRVRKPTQHLNIAHFHSRKTPLRM